MKLAILSAVLILDATLWTVGLALCPVFTLAVVAFVALAIVQIWRTAARVGVER